MKWKEHLLDNKSSLIKQLNQRLNGVILVSKRASFSTRLMLANGVYLSKLVYLIQVWGGTQEYLIRALQVTQNKAMKAVTRMSWFTPTGVLLRKCNWLSVRQLIHYHTMLTMHKTVTNQSPVYIYDKVNTHTHHDTRRQVKFSDKFTGRSERTQSSFCYRGAKQYNQLPFEITSLGNINSFKRKLKTWVKNNIAVD